MSSSYLEALYNASIEKAVRRNLTLVSPSDTISDVVANMVRDDIGVAVIVEEGIILGIITEKDVLQRVMIPKKNPNETLVKNVMTKEPISIDVNRSIKDALELMRNQNIKRLLVLKKAALFGIVTERRILNLINFRVSELFEHLISNK